MRVLLLGCIMFATVSKAGAIHQIGALGKRTPPTPPVHHTSPEIPVAAYLPGEQPTQILLLSEVTDPIWDDFWHGRLGDAVIECPEGSELPLIFKFKSNLFSLVEEPLKLKVDRTFYLRYLGADFLFSLDAVDWWSFSQFFRGKINADFDIIDNEPEVSIELELLK